MIDLFAPGAYVRCPGGNVELMPAQAPVIRWAALNVGTDPCVAAGWARQRQLYTSAGIAYFPWRHCRSLDDARALIAIGRTWADTGGARVIGLNVEDVAGDGLILRQLGALVADQWVAFGGQVHMATLPWVQNGQGWQYMAYAVAALEIMPDEQTSIFPNGYDPKVVQDCIDHAFAEGLTKVTLMFKTKAPNTRAQYGDEYAICHSLYTADDIPPTVEAWGRWDYDGACQRPSKEPPMLSESKFPYTGPLYGPSNANGPTTNRATVKGLKRALVRLNYLDQELADLSDDFGAAMERALRAWQKDVDLLGSGQYGRASWMKMRAAKLPSGAYAMDPLALQFVRQDAYLICHPHVQGARSSICQGLHMTAGLTGNWAIDFCAAGGTQVVAVENAKITKLSGRDPADGAEQAIGIFGWSIHYETPMGYRYFSTHYGTRESLRVGQLVDCGQVIGTVGRWPGDPGRSHTHLGVTSPKGYADAKNRILAVAAAPRVVAV